MATIDDFALCIPAELMAEVKAWAAHDTTSLNAFMVDAVAEKIAALRERAWLAERGGRGRMSEFDRVLAKAGAGAPREGDDVPEGWMAPAPAGRPGPAG